MNPESPTGLASRHHNLQFVATLSRTLDMSAFDPVRKQAGGRLAGVGDTITHLPLLVSGTVQAVIYQSADDGNEVVPVVWEEGELVLMSQLCLPDPLGVDVVAASDIAYRHLPIAAIERSLSQSPELMMQLVHFLTVRLREVQSRERVWLERGVHERVCASLARIARTLPVNDDGAVALTGTHESLAARCAVSRPRLSRELKQLEDAGRLKLGRGVIEITDVRWFSGARW